MLRSWLRYHLAALLILPPFLIGAVHARTQIALALTAGLFVLLVGFRVAIRREGPAQLYWNGWMWLFVAAWAWTAFQLIPLPLSVVASLSPEAYQIFQLMFQAAGIDSTSHWQPLSLAPADTMLKWVRDMGAISLFFGVLHWCNSRQHMRDLLRISTLAAIGLICLTLLQTALGLSRPLMGLYSPQMQAVGLLKGSPFVNYNHLGGYLLFHAVLCIWCIYDEEKSIRKWLWGAGFLALSIGVFGSLSRGAILAYLVGCAGALWLIGRKVFVLDPPKPPMKPEIPLAPKKQSEPKSKRRRRKKKPKRSSRDPKPIWVGWKILWENPVLRNTALSLLLLVGVGVHFFSVYIAKEFADSTKLEKNKPAIVAQFAGPLLKRYPLVGVGRGAMAMGWHRHSTMQMSNSGQETVTHAESQVLQPLIDWGWLFGVLFLVIGGWLFFQLLRTSKGLLEQLSCLALVVLCLQNILDFNLEFPGNAFPFLAVLAGVIRLQAHRRKAHLQTQFAIALPVAVGIITILATGLSARYALAHQFKKLPQRWSKVANAPKASFAKELKKLIPNHPSDFTLPLHVALYHIKEKKPQYKEALRWLLLAEKLNPTSVGLFMLRARIYVKLGLAYQTTLALDKVVKLRSRWLLRAAVLLTRNKFEAQAVVYAKEPRLFLEMWRRWLIKIPDQALVKKVKKKRDPAYRQRFGYQSPYIEYCLARYKQAQGEPKKTKPWLYAIHKGLQVLEKYVPKSKGYSLFVSGRLLATEGEWQKAAKAFQHVVTLNQSHQWPSTMWLMNLYLQHKEYEHLSALLIKAKARFTSNKMLAHLFSIEGRMYTAQKKHKRAHHAYEEAISLTSNDMDWLRLANACWELGRTRCAFRILKRMIKQPKFKTLKKKLKNWEDQLQQQRSSILPYSPRPM